MKKIKFLGYVLLVLTIIFFILGAFKLDSVVAFRAGGKTLFFGDGSGQTFLTVFPSQFSDGQITGDYKHWHLLDLERLDYFIIKHHNSYSFSLFDYDKSFGAYKFFYSSLLNFLIPLSIIFFAHKKEKKNIEETENET